MRQTDLLHRQLGAVIESELSTRFSVWAPDANRVVVDVVDGPLGVLLEKLPTGYHVGVIDEVTAGRRYFYRVDGGPPRPDPASRFQPDGVHGPSQVVNPHSFDWTDQSWRGVKRDDLIIYEMHVGTFTEVGTFSGAIARLPELVELGVTAIELMPVAASAGRWNWGYDGVAMFAPMDAYGTPDDFRQFVDAAHAAGLAVLLDVVYNHLGPEGNYLHDFGPYLSSKHHTVWGDAPNFDDQAHGDAVREWFISNAIYWLDEFHLDGLRVDAIHCMVDEREPHIAAELAEAVDQWSQSADRCVVMIAESNVYDPEMTVPQSEGGIGFDAMWGDDFLHSTFAVLRPGEQLSQRTYESKTDLQQVLQHGYIYEGTLRRKRERQALTKRVETHGLVYSIQNHDFIGNHPLGVRLHQLTSDQAHRAAATLLMMTPAIPMLFQGEEFASPHPFRFFVDFSDQHLRDSVVQGRRREYPQHDWDNGVLPTERSAFDSAKIGNREDGNAMTLKWYTELIALRKRSRASGLLVDQNLRTEIDLARDLYALHYQNSSAQLSIVVRLGSNTAASLDYSARGRVVLDSQRIGRISDKTESVKIEQNHAVIFEKPALAKTAARPSN